MQVEHSMISAVFHKELTLATSVGFTYNCTAVRGNAPDAKSNTGEWRSLVAHLTGGQVAAGSNPVAPTR